MNKEYFFGNGKWIGAAERRSDGFYIIRSHFNISNAERASINVIGLGFFKCYINGKCINPDTFLPLSSNYERTCDPPGTELYSHRIYVPSFDITADVCEGDNTIAIEFGGGWYTNAVRVFGMPKAIYRITVKTNSGNEEFVSDESALISEGRIGSYRMETHEVIAHPQRSALLKKYADERDMEPVTACEAVCGEYCSTDCPADALIKEIIPTLISDNAGRRIYDCGVNLSGYPLIRTMAAAGEQIDVFFSEALTTDGKLDPNRRHNQRFSVISDGENRLVQPEFTWFGFRYLEIGSDAEIECVKRVHADVTPSSTFESDNETINWIYNTFVNSMLTNMHTGHPSDCPHLERLGYTGDGQLTAHASLLAVGARKLYEKWLADISDSQDVISGRISYSAPFVRCGGGPGGWGCAIIEVPYQLYRHYGDKEILERYYDQMKRYIDYLEDHSEFSLVTSDRPDGWCLGDWCGPMILYPHLKLFTTRDWKQQIFVPAPYVNTYFMVKSLLTLAKIAKVIGKQDDISIFEEKAEVRKRAIKAAYFNTFDNNFVMNAQGANAYAIDIGLGTETTYANLVSYYDALGHYDTGIFGTDILTRILFRHGNADLAVKLLTTDGDQGFEHWRKSGATTLLEYWDVEKSRSHNHPMFGAVVSTFFDDLLGIRQVEGTAGYTALVIEPQATDKFGRMSGSITTARGKIAVAYRRSESAMDFEITIPENTDASLKFGGRIYELTAGKNVIRHEVR